MSIRTSILSLIVLGSVAGTSLAGENMIGQGNDRRDPSQGLLNPSGMNMDHGRLADAGKAQSMGASGTHAMGASSAQPMGASDTQTMGASRAEATMPGDRMTRQQSGNSIDLGLLRGGN